MTRPAPSATSASTGYTAEDEALFGKISRHLLPLLTVCYLIAFLDRINIGFAQLQMQADLGFSNTAYALGAGLFFLGYFAFEVPSNLLLEKFGARKSLFRIMFLWGIVASAMMYVRTPGWFYALRFLLGVFEAGFFPGVILYLTYWYPSARRAKAVAIFMAGATIAFMIAGPISGATMKYLNGFLDHAGWQWLFVTQGIPASILGIIILIYLPDRPEAAKWLTPAEQARLRNHMDNDPQAVEGGKHHSMLAMVSDIKVWALALVWFLALSAIYVMVFWTPSLIRSWGVQDVLTIGLLAAIAPSITIVTMIVIGRSSDRHKERRWHYAFCVVLGLIGGLVAVMAKGHIGWSIVGLTLITTCQSASSPIFFSAISEYLPKNTAAAGIAFVSSMGNLGPVAFPAIVAWVVSAAGTADAGIFLVMALWLLSGIVLLLTVRSARSSAGAKLAPA